MAIDYAFGRLSNLKILTMAKMPLSTSKATLLNKSNILAFIVDIRATKPEIVSMVRTMFGIKKVLSVRTIIIKGKKKRSLKTRQEYHESDFKKVYIRLAKDDFNINGLDAMVSNESDTLSHATSEEKDFSKVEA